jgi:hypothetical protein
LDPITIEKKTGKKSGGLINPSGRNEIYISNMIIDPNRMVKIIRMDISKINMCCQSLLMPFKPFLPAMNPYEPIRSIVMCAKTSHSFHDTMDHDTRKSRGSKLIARKVMKR